MRNVSRRPCHGLWATAAAALLVLGVTSTTPAAAAEPAARHPPPHPARPATVPPPRAPAPIRPAAPMKTVLALSANFGKGLSDITSGLRWRVFLDQPDSNGDYALVADTTDARPLLALEPGGYIVDVVYGLVSQTRRIALGTTTDREAFTLDCGALRLVGRVGTRQIPASEIHFILRRKQSGSDTHGTITVKTGEIARLPAGSYEITSTYGSANARVISEARVEAGKLTDAVVHQRAGHVHLRLATPPVPAGSRVQWSVLTPGGDAVVDLTGTHPDVVLAEGDYTVVTRIGEQSRQVSFSIKAGGDETVTMRDR